VQKLLREKSGDSEHPHSDVPAAMPEREAEPAVAQPDDDHSGIDVFRLIALRNRLADALKS
jgi:hypothetical protein